MSTAISAEALALPSRRARLLLYAGAAFLFLQAAALVLAPSARRSAWDFAADTFQPLALAATWLVAALVTSRAAARLRPEADHTLLPVAFLLSGWGILAIWRISPAFAWRQAALLWVASVALLLVLRSPPDLRWLRRYRYVWLMAGLATIGLTLFLGTSPSGGDPKLWLGCCGLYFQPSEPLRLLLVAFLASFLGERLSGGWGERRPGLVPALAPLLLVWGISVMLLLVQRDLGTGSLFLIVLAVLVYLASGRAGVLAAAAGLTVTGAAVGYLALALVRARVETWLNPWLDTSGASYQVVQGLIAYASGGVFGRGPGLGSPGFVPLAHSDMVFAVVVEETGLLGGLAVIGLLAFLVQRGLRLAMARRGPFDSILAAGLALTIGLQSVLILGGGLRLLPLTGVTLPFLSYGGSSLVTNFIGLGLLLATRPGGFGREALGRRLTGIQLGLSGAWIALALLLGWWTVVRAPDLTGRRDNPRRGREGLYAQRGSILDREGDVLAKTEGERGEYRRVYADVGASAVLGYDSARYGQAGIEETLDSWLRGEEGHPALDVLWSRLVRGVPLDGMSAGLSLDSGIQHAAWTALGEGPGAVIVLEAESGSILALVSAPGFDSSEIDRDWSTLRDRQDAPLLNRATQGVYQPGLVLGPLFVAWGERLGLVHPGNAIAGLTAPVIVDGHRLPCAFSPPPQTVGTMAAALRYGCPIGLAGVGEVLGRTALQEAAVAFGLGEAPTEDLVSAHPAAIERILEGADLSQVGIGQGQLLVSPLQVARAFAALAGDGFLPSPRLILEIESPNGGWLPWGRTEEPVAAVPPEIATAILQLLARDPLGNAGYGAYAIAGPTGDRVAWYVAIAEQGRSPVIALAVLEGGTTVEAGRIALAVLGLEGSPSPP